MALRAFRVIDGGYGIVDIYCITWSGTFNGKNVGIKEVVKDDPGSASIPIGKGGWIAIQKHG